MLEKFAAYLQHLFGGGQKRWGGSPPPNLAWVAWVCLAIAVFWFFEDVLEFQADFPQAVLWAALPFYRVLWLCFILSTGLLFSIDFWHRCTSFPFFQLPVLSWLYQSSSNVALPLFSHIESLYNEMWLRHKEKQNLVICKTMDENGDHHTNHNNPGTGRQV